MEEGDLKKTAPFSFRSSSTRLMSPAIQYILQIFKFTYIRKIYMYTGMFKKSIE
jgi:hypothetical protein